MISRLRVLICVTAISLSVPAGAFAELGEAATSAGATGEGERRRTSAQVLAPRERKQVDDSIDRALAWLARRQLPDGSFQASSMNQPAITSLCLLAFLARGHLPGTGPFGPQIDAGIEYTLSKQGADGLISFYGHREITHGIYNHSITGLLLCEVYGMTDKAHANRVRPVIERAIAFTCRHQDMPKRWKVDVDGWRYLRHRGSLNDSDLSVTSWQLIFLRSAKNAGFDVPTETVERGLRFVDRCFDERQGTFLYGLNGDNRRPNRGMAGAGILSLSLAGLHNTDKARTAGDFLLRHPFDRYNVHVGTHLDRFHYGAFYCSQAMFQLGRHYWEQFYPTLVGTLLENQKPDGSWQPERGQDQRIGNVYTTALVVLALSPPYQLLPIFQR